jgi:hypothetical protein
MKNAVFLLSVWVGIIVAAYAMVYWDWGIEPPLPISLVEPVESRYADPNGRFGLVFPSTWDLEVAEALVLLTDPSGQIEVTVSSVEEPVPEAALLLALGITDAEPGSEPVAVEGVSPPGAAERAVKIIGPADDGEASYGVGYLYEGRTIVLLVRGSGKALEDRFAELGRIEAGIAIPAVVSQDTVPVEDLAPVVEL